ncbi:beta-1,3-galactosyl-O-glycosyl-glycoprotein beta-1,6-N-acetylglucosaminyltransferase 7 isoform X2 [Conger conger]|nr:beta-1,3-galactosyl-O-glycosyl-glycoprotein beta-1,6-N-acetylglucosaminyltransferase 7 isoform X2 [Conger conger]
MLQLEGTKCRFLVCLGLCVFICSAIYLKAKVSNSPTTQYNSTLVHTVRCRPFPRACKELLGGREGTEWERGTCLTEAYLTAPNLNCSRVAGNLHFITSALSSEEEEYPLAFIITIHKELEMFVRLLRAVYAPQNVYCVHVDGKAPPWYKEAVERLAGCFPNVFLASTSERVTYAGFSRLQADINCMRDLVKSPVPWRKVFNLCGQDFPIMSNLELVRYLQSKQWRDRNMTPGVKQPPAIRHRTERQYKEVDGSHTVPKGQGRKKGPPPHKLQIYFGTAYYALTRPFVDFVLQNKVAKDLLEWSKDTYSPDEHYWVTLNHLVDAPGNHVNGGWEGGIRAIKWSDQEGKSHPGCKGRYVRGICVYGLEDLQWIVNRRNMFANKFAPSSFPEAVDCVEEWHRQKVLRQAEIPIKRAWRLTVETREVAGRANLTTGPS